VSEIVLVTWDGGGNVPPALGLAANLQARGHHVRFLAHPQQRSQLEGAGFSFTPFRAAMPWSPLTPAAGLSGAWRYGRMFTDRGMGADLREMLAAQPADLVVVDALLLGVLEAARSLTVPYAALVHTYQQYLVRPWSRGPIGLIARTRRLQPTRLWDAADLVLVAADATLDPATKTSLPGNVRHVGVIQPDPQGRRREETDQPRVLVSLSTNYFPGQQQALQSVLDGLAELPIQVIATTGAVPVEDLRTPPNAELHKTQPHTAVMPTVQAVVGHGGHATTMLALAHDLPLVVLPMHPMLDQKMIGQSVAEQEAAVLLTRKATPQQIRTAVRNMLASAEARAAAARLGAQLRAQDGATVAADHLLALLNTPSRDRA
jgi:UDP:flavonoid glycosyltransferase YjiC (YdhE family)